MHSVERVRPFLGQESGISDIALQLFVKPVIETLLHRQCSSSVQPNMALIELGDAHPGDFALADRQAVFLVGALAADGT
jgi:hypothetical protein